MAARTRHKAAVIASVGGVARHCLWWRRTGLGRIRLSRMASSLPGASVSEPGSMPVERRAGSGVAGRG